MIEVTLTESEQAIARYMAKRRQQYARSNGIKDQKIGAQSGEEGDLNGFGAELAFARISNTYPDLSVNHDVLPDADVVFRTGHTIDVKVTKYRNGHLIAQPGKSKSQVDLYACMIGEFPTYRLAGFMSRSELIREDRLRDFGYGNNRAYAARQDELDLWESARAEPMVQEFLKVFRGEIAAVKLPEGK